MTTDAEPESVTLKARDIKPYHYGVWCATQDEAGNESKPFSNTIVHIRWSDDGKHLWFGLETHNTMKVEPDEEVEVIPERGEHSQRTREKYAGWVLPPPPTPKIKPALDEVTAEARRLSTAVDRLEGESLEVLAALGLHEDTEHAEALAHIRTLVQEHAEMRLAIEGRRKRADLDELLARVEQGARAVERDKVVAWLRVWQSQMDDRITHDDVDYAIRVIERGEHRKGGNHD